MQLELGIQGGSEHGSRIALGCVNPLEVMRRPQRSSSNGDFSLQYSNSKASNNKEPLLNVKKSSMIEGLR